ncbi:cora-domain-containing protein [Eremomyces bilateralis CBS 781.70]|uniref:Cora-domain-containing protein n=1 Tax=Eremomyces bilateralis CBS 781.70 TaxID=1392243 RepID=A0A6G1G233_9PEZI|nr:cora-domain-containing protein [Eremomyces bilateralis CBS 781.70]KAF1812103.1 cora-domain-containing protein [Eremomyces bilateralis CBS 781.70]
MSDSPRTERFDTTRYSTPVSELDDHRRQPSSLPRIDPPPASGSAPFQTTRRGTLASLRLERPELFADASHLGVAGLNEQAIIDDGQSGHGVLMDWNSPVSPRMTRRGTFRRTPREQGGTASIPSRRSSATTLSESPPNSVNAFADPRRRERTGTITSQIAPDQELEIQRSISGASHRRKATFTDGHSVEEGNGTIPRGNDDEESVRSSIEEDVCYPQEDVGKTFRIDYEELEEYIVEAAQEEEERRAEAARQAAQAEANLLERQTTRGGSTGGEIEEKIVSDSEVDQPTPAQPHAVPATIAPASRFTLFSSESDDTIHASTFGGLLAEGERVIDLFEPPLQTGGVYWLDMLNPPRDAVHAICKAFGVHPLTREDIVTQESREKVELFRAYYFLAFRSFFSLDKESEEYMEPVNIYAVVFREGLLTFSYTANPHASNVRSRISKLRDYLQLGSDWVCYALIDDIVDSFAPVIHEIEVETDRIEDEVLIVREDDGREMLRAIGDCRKKVMSLIRLLGGKADVIKGFAKRCNDQYAVAPRGDVGMYLSDIQDHVVTMMSNLTHFEKILGRSHSNYIAQISLDSLTQGNRVNENLSKVTVLATIIVPLNIVTGLFGMNVRVPGQPEGVGTLGWFFGILGIIMAFVISGLLYARAKRMI